jgi:Uma2 family endonuclease
MSMPATLYYSAEMVRALPEDGNRYETVHGELLVSPSPRFSHQLLLQRLSFVLMKYLEATGVEGLFCVDADISWGPDTLVQPDLFVADPEELQRAQGWADIQTLHLVVEVLSPSSLRADRFTKRRLYQEQRIPAYWIIDIENRQVEAWTPDALFPVVERDRLTWRHPAAAAECVIELAELFRSAT